MELTAVVAALIAAAAIAASYFVPARVLTDLERQRLLPSPLPEEHLPLGANVMGGPDSRAGILLFTDLECRACAAVSRDSLEVIKEFVDEGLVTFAIRFVPRSATRDAAKRALCASGQGRFWQVQEVLYRVRAEPVRDDLPDRLGLNRRTFDDCVSGSSDVELRENIYLANRINLEVRPTMFVGSLDTGHRLKVVYRIYGYIEASRIREIVSRVVTDDTQGQPR